MAFNLDRLSEGLGARFAPSHGDRARPFSANSRPRAALDTLEPSPITVVLSAEKAKARLREIVEGFFFRRLRSEDGKAHRAPARQKPARSGKDERGYPLGNPVSGGAGREGLSARANR